MLAIAPDECNHGTSPFYATKITLSPCVTQPGPSPLAAAGVLGSTKAMCAPAGRGRPNGSRSARCQSLVDLLDADAHLPTRHLAVGQQLDFDFRG